MLKENFVSKVASCSAKKREELCAFVADFIADIVDVTINSLLPQWGWSGFIAANKNSGAFIKSLFGSFLCACITLYWRTVRRRITCEIGEQEEFEMYRIRQIYMKVFYDKKIVTYSYLRVSAIVMLNNWILVRLKAVFMPMLWILHAVLDVNR